MTDQIARIRITLDDIQPAIWRWIELPISNSLKTLHLAIQAVMLFENYHLFRFDIGDASYGIRFDDGYMDPPTRDAGNLRLAKLIDRGDTTFTILAMTGGTASSSKRFCSLTQQPIIPGLLTARAAHRQRMSAASQGSSSSSTLWATRAIPSTSLC